MAAKQARDKMDATAPGQGGLFGGQQDSAQQQADKAAQYRRDLEQQMAAKQARDKMDATAPGQGGLFGGQQDSAQQQANKAAQYRRDLEQQMAAKEARERAEKLQAGGGGLFGAREDSKEAAQRKAAQYRQELQGQMAAKEAQQRAERQAAVGGGLFGQREDSADGRAHVSKAEAYRKELDAQMQERQNAKSRHQHPQQQNFSFTDQFGKEDKLKAEKEAKKAEAYRRELEEQIRLRDAKQEQQKQLADAEDQSTVTGYRVIPGGSPVPPGMASNPHDHNLETIVQNTQGIRPDSRDGAYNFQSQVKDRDNYVSALDAQVQEAKRRKEQQKQEELAYELKMEAQLKREREELAKQYQQEQAAESKDEKHQRELKEQIEENKRIKEARLAKERADEARDEERLARQRRELEEQSLNKTRGSKSNSPKPQIPSPVIAPSNPPQTHMVHQQPAAQPPPAEAVPHQPLQAQQLSPPLNATQSSLPYTSSPEPKGREEAAPTNFFKGTVGTAARAQIEDLQRQLEEQRHQAEVLAKKAEDATLRRQEEKSAAESELQRLRRELREKEAKGDAVKPPETQELEETGLQKARRELKCQTRQPVPDSETVDPAPGTPEWLRDCRGGMTIRPGDGDERELERLLQKYGDSSTPQKHNGWEVQPLSGGVSPTPRPLSGRRSMRPTPRAGVCESLASETTFVYPDGDGDAKPDQWFGQDKPIRPAAIQTPKTSRDRSRALQPPTPKSEQKQFDTIDRISEANARRLRELQGIEGCVEQPDQVEVLLGQFLEQREGSTEGVPISLRSPPRTPKSFEKPPPWSLNLHQDMAKPSSSRPNSTMVAESTWVEY